MGLASITPCPPKPTTQMTIKEISIQNTFSILFLKLSCWGFLGVGGGIEEINDSFLPLTLEARMQQQDCTEFPVR